MYKFFPPAQYLSLISIFIYYSVVFIYEAFPRIASQAITSYRQIYLADLPNKLVEASSYLDEI